MTYRMSLIALSFGACFAFMPAAVYAAQSLLPQDSPVQIRLGFFGTLANSPEIYDKGRYDLLASTYDHLLSGEQNITKIKTLDNEQLRLLFRAADTTAFYTYQPRYVNDMRLDLKQMEQRHIAAKADYQHLYEELTAVRMFNAAREFYAAHSGLGLPPLPAYADKTGSANGRKPTVLKLSTTELAMTRQAVNLDGPSQVVILTDPFCHFANNFATALKAHPDVRNALNGHTIWLAPPNSVLQFTTLQKWNRSHPAEQIEIMFQPGEWSMVKIMQTPTFYFLKGGMLTATVVGWPESGNFKALQASLEKIDLLGEK